jgi:parvulin-like peptidyl-prolyl isomerase
VIKRLLVVGCLGIAAAPGAPAAEPGSSTTWAFLKPPLPGTPASCPDAAPAGPGLVKVDLFADRSAGCPVASVEGDVLTLDELNESLAAIHQSRSGATSGAKQDPTAILNRMIDFRLVVLDARTMGIDELPEVATSVAEMKEAAAREILQARVLKDVKPDPREVDRLFKDAVREWKLDSVLFTREADAKAMATEVRKGGDFDALAKAAIATKLAKGGTTGGQFVDASKLVPPILGAIAKLKEGGVSAPVRLPEGYAVVQVEGIRYPENPTARAEAEQTSLGVQRKKALKAYYEGLEKKYAKIDRALVKKLDFDAKKPGIETLKKDTRVVARVQGTPPITVGELAKRLEQQFFHGAGQQAERKRLNRAKQDTLDALVSPRVIALEVEKQGIEKTPEFDRQVAKSIGGLLFNVFLSKVIIPEVKLTEPEVERYYAAHKAEYSYPAFYKLESIGFVTAKDAEEAVAKLRGGTDFKWLNANADGKLPDAQATEKVSGILAATALTQGLTKALEGARTGDYRVYASGAKQFYAVHVMEYIPPSAQPYAEVREAIATKAYGESIQKAAEEYIAKLRKAHDVKVFLTRIGS